MFDSLQEAAIPFAVNAVSVDVSTTTWTPYEDLIDDGKKLVYGAFR
mgnify:CR=1 FL=1